MFVKYCSLLQYTVPLQKKSRVIQQSITLYEKPLEQVTRFKYVGSWITLHARSNEDIRTRAEIAKAAFWQNKELMGRNVRFSTKVKILNC